MKRDDSIVTGKLILLAGLAGGAAEVLWVALYSGVTGTSAMAVARQVAASVWPAAADWASAPVLGIAIHMALALALAAAFVPFLLCFAARHPGPGTIMAGATAVLVLVWAVNFFLILPVLNPAFVTLMPYGTTLTSKLLFGATIAWVTTQRAPLRDTARRDSRNQ